MNLKAYLGNRIRGWLPKESYSTSFCRATDSKSVQEMRGTLTFRYLLFFLIAIFLRLIGLPFFPRAEVVDIPLVLMAIAAAASLIAVICETRTGRTSTLTRLSSRLAVDLGIGCIIYVVIATFVYLTGPAVQGILLLTIFLSYTIAFIIGTPMSKKILKSI